MAMPFLSLDRDTGFLLAHIRKILRDLVPVDDIPPVGDILWSTVLVLEKAKKTREKHDANMRFPKAIQTSEAYWVTTYLQVVSVFPNNEKASQVTTTNSKITETVRELE